MPAPRFFIIIRAPNGDVREVPLGASSVVIGRDESSDIQVEDKKVSRRHAAFKVVDDQPWVEDLGSINGVKLNGERVDQRAVFTFGDQIKIGGYIVTLKDDVELSDTRQRDDEESMAGLPAGTALVRLHQAAEGHRLRLLGMSEPVQDRVFELSSNEAIIGRLDECDVVVLHGSVSRQHARIIFRPEESKLTVHDLDSANGVYLGKKRVRWADVRPGDQLTIGNVRFQVDVQPALEFGPPRMERLASGYGWGAVMMGLLGLAMAAGVLAAAILWKSDGGTDAAQEAWNRTWAMLQGRSPNAESPSDPGEAAPGDGAASGPDGASVQPAGSEKPAGSEEPAARDPSPAPLQDGSDVGSQAVAGTYPSSGVLASVVTDRPVTPSTFTATSPYTRRADDGLPAHLPAVDPSLDLDELVRRELRAAKFAEAKADYEAFRSHLEVVLEHDPLHEEARQLRERATLYALGQKALARADALVDSGRIAEAYRVLDQVPSQMPLRPEAERRSRELRDRALIDALGQGMKAFEGKEYDRAHEMAAFALSLDPENRNALDLIRRAEKKMRKRKMAYRTYRPTTAPAVDETTDDLEAAIEARYPGKPELARSVLQYARGDVDGAVRQARSVPSRDRALAQRTVDTVKDLKSRYDRIRTEVSNDPSRAWSMLLGMKRAERQILPDGSKSYLVRELEVALSDAFAKRGASRFRENQYEEAFRKWQAGYRLDPTHPEIRAGLSRLEGVATQLAQEAELLGQRGNDAACAQWRRITQMTPPDSEVHRRARGRAAQTCM